jgi:hypothetical protein
MSKSLLDRLRARTDSQVRKAGPKCTACVLPKETLEAVRTLAAEGKPLTVIARTLIAEGLGDVQPFTLQKHFRDHEQPSR